MTSKTRIKHLIRIIEDKGKKGKGVGSSKPNRVAPEPQAAVNVDEIIQNKKMLKEAYTKLKSNGEKYKMYLSSLQKTPLALWDQKSINNLTTISNYLGNTYVKNLSKNQKIDLVLLYKHYESKKSKDKKQIEEFIKENRGTDGKFNPNKGKELADLIYKIHNPLVSIIELKKDRSELKEMIQTAMGTIPPEYTENIGKKREYGQNIIKGINWSAMKDEVIKNVKQKELQGIRAQMINIESDFFGYSKLTNDNDRAAYIAKINTRGRNQSYKALKNILPDTQFELSLNTGIPEALSEAASSVVNSSPVAAISRTVSGISQSSPAAALRRGLSFGRLLSSDSSPSSPIEDASPAARNGSGLKKKKSKSK